MPPPSHTHTHTHTHTHMRTLVKEKENIRSLGFRCEVAENFALLGYCVMSSGNFLPTFQDNFLVDSCTLGMGSMGCPETSVKKLTLLTA